MPGFLYFWRGSIHPPGRRVGTGGRTCNRPGDLHDEQRTGTGKRRASWPRATRLASGDVCQRSQREQ